MQDEYDFSQGRRGAVATDADQKSRITAYLDNDVLDALKAQAQAESKASGAKIGYQTVLNRTLRQALDLDKASSPKAKELTVGEMSETRLRQILHDVLGQSAQNTGSDQQAQYRTVRWKTVQVTRSIGTKAVYRAPKGKFRTV